VPQSHGPDALWKGRRRRPLPSATTPQGRHAQRRGRQSPGPIVTPRSPQSHRARDRMPARKKDRATEPRTRCHATRATDRSSHRATDRTIAQSHGRAIRRAAPARPGEARSGRRVGSPRSCSCERRSSGRPRLVLAPSPRATNVLSLFRKREKEPKRETSQTPNLSLDPSEIHRTKLPQNRMPA